MCDDFIAIGYVFGQFVKRMPRGSAKRPMNTKPVILVLPKRERFINFRQSLNIAIQRSEKFREYRFLNPFHFAVQMWTTWPYRPEFNRIASFGWLSNHFSSLD